MKIAPTVWLRSMLCGAALLAFAASAQVPATNIVSSNGVAASVPKLPSGPSADYTNGVGMALLEMPGGYWAGKFEVTQREYQKVMGVNPSAFPGPDRPVENISWQDAVEFCRKLTEQEIKDKELPPDYRYSLPTEDQWEALVANAGLADAVTSEKRSQNGTSPVGSLHANSNGLFDTRGNVSEFCAGDTKPYRVLRGGNWQDRIEINLRLNFRIYCRPDERKNTYGFRCVLLLPGK